MRILFKVFIPLIPIVLLLLSSCAPTKFVSVFKEDAYEGGNIKSVLVVGVTENQINRRLFEDTFTAQFKKKGVDAVASYTVIPTFNGLNKETVLSEAERLGVKTILATNLLGVQKEHIHFNPLDYDPVKKRHSFGSYFPAATEYAHSPVSYTKIEQVRL